MVTLIDITQAESDKPQNIVDLTAYLPNNHVKDGSVDYTTFIQQGLNKHSSVKLPNFPISINERGLTIPSNRKIYFGDNSQLILIPSTLERYEIVRIHNVKNVSIYGASIRGDRKMHRGSSGQWGMGISICGSENIEIIDGKIEDCWGDGLYIGRIDDSPSAFVTVKGVELYSNRRNGMSITSARDVLIDNIKIFNTGGQSPESGIDIEPNSNRDVIDNIVLNNIYTQDNKRYGIIVSLNRLIGHRPKEINIRISNHTDSGSGIGFGMSSVNSGVRDNFKGEVVVEDCVWQLNKERAVHYSKHNYSLLVRFKNIRTKDKRNDKVRSLNQQLRKIKGVRVH